MKTRRAQFVRSPLAALFAAAAVASFLLLTACGGGGGGVGPPTSPLPLAVTTTSLPDAISGHPYSLTLTASGGVPPYSWSLGQGSSSLPPGLTLSSAGLLSGVPEPVSGSGWTVYQVTFRVSDSKSSAATRYFDFNAEGPLKIISTSLPDGNVGVWYRADIAFSGGRPLWTWSLAPGSNPLPVGLSISEVNAGVWGTPTQAGTFEFTVQGKDSGNPGQTATGTIHLFIDNRVVVTTQFLPYAVANWPYRESLQAMGGTPPYAWIAQRTMPPGLGLSSSGEVSGTPTQRGLFTIEVQVTDSSVPPQSAYGYPMLYVRPPLAFVTTALNDGVRGSAYNSSVSTQGGRPPYAFRVSSGSLPPGLGLYATSPDAGDSFVSGTPTEVGLFSFTLEATDSSSPPATVTRDFTIRVHEPLEITTTSLPDGMTGDSYNATLTAAGGFPPYTWTAAWLPRGLTLDSLTGQISGTPTEAYNGELVVRVQDSASPRQQHTGVLHLTILGRLSITTSRLPAGRPNVPYQISIGLFGGTPPYAWSIASGALPSGLTLNSATGQITGTPTTEETQSFTVHVTDAGPPVQTTSRQLSLTITSSLGRNDWIATATPISNGTFRASISPYADPISGPAYPDNDYYVLTANPGATVTVETVAGRRLPESPLDSVIEIVDSAGARFNTCRAPDYPYGPYNLPCLNDDIDLGYILDSKLEFQVPGTGSEPVTFHIHVLDWSGSARPDFIYDLSIFGAN